MECIEKDVKARYNILSDMDHLLREVQAEEIWMLKNNIEADIKVKFIESGITQAQLAEKIKTAGPMSIAASKGKTVLGIRTLCRCWRILG